MLPAIHDTGTGEAVLFLHAFTMDASQWDHQVAALSGDMRCVRVDLWGCGDSPPPPEVIPAWMRFAAAVLDALDSRNIDRVAVVGLSMGGYLAFALWRLAPERIRALALCNTRAGSRTRWRATTVSPWRTWWSASSRSSRSWSRWSLGC